MLIRFHGADRTVTGSCHLVEANGLRVLLDCGMYQGPRERAREINLMLPDDLKEIDAVVLSHGHLDHCGRLPMLIRGGFRGKVYCTPATADVARIVMTDAADIQEEDANYLNRRSAMSQRGPIVPLFTRKDVDGVLRAMVHVPYGRRTELGSGVSFTFHDAGHILGSAYVVLEAKEGPETRRLLFTADVGRYGTPIIRDPSPVPAAEGGGGYDAIITESTYGTIKHAPMQDVGPQLLEILKGAVERKGRVILPSFAVGRTQTMLWYVEKFIAEKKLPEIPVFVDSPMGSEVSAVTAKHPDSYDDETRRMVCDPSGKCDLFGLARVTFAVSQEESMRINQVKGASVVIASSPTCEFGRVLHHLKRSVENPDDAVVFVGWTPPGTLGRRLQDAAASPAAVARGGQARGSAARGGGAQGGGEPRRVRILDRFYDLRCRVHTLHGLSAHADGDELLRFLTPAIGPKTTAFVVHGEEDRCDGFAARLTAAGVRTAIAPAMDSAAVVGRGEMSVGAHSTATDE